MKKWEMLDTTPDGRKPGQHWFLLVHSHLQIVNFAAVLTNVTLLAVSSVPDKAYGHIQSTLFAKQGQM